MDASRPCFDLLEENGGAEVSPAQGEQPFLTGNQCEAIKTRELRALLLEIPQEDQNPMELSLGVKSEAQEAAAVLGFNFPGSEWYQDSYYLMTGEGTPAPSDEKRGWFFGLF